MKSRDSKTEAQLGNIPHARPAYPDSSTDKLKYLFWRVITPFHPYVRDLLSYIKILRNEGRQNYLLGRLAPHQSIEDFVAFLLEKGYGNHFIAFTDEGQAVSLRYSPNFQYQYHIRVFHDGEVRGHYEYTPEYKPIAHLREVGMEARFEEFLELLGDRIIPAQLSTSNNFTWSFMGAIRRAE